MVFGAFVSQDNTPGLVCPGPGVPLTRLCRTFGARPAYRIWYAVRSRGQARETLPPAASIFSLADVEKASAVTFTVTEISPDPRTFTG